ncbi:esterase-like activity of phytase family protein [Bifidobacterium crudilactis]|jgi:hypothetical protein|uniref:Phosphatase PAP2 family protein n=3 Tax=Bifidobacterium crudilactis TaxID=327277 RepID=A0A971CY68_9BIFI|nr:esterase-like activity of phytase family protein [Bifidobacterium crudilactis]MCI1869274.1 esterase-like activity of phytase family protein [Bifidobacterium crudilactis]MDN5972485.1 esterase-like activity of phytase family protein [Bifidobacterium crudilactis]MDN6000931.1 esterase-like activity of phytase family protein [Bifidobacterium crudilactis]MDN6467337.1 esterase-like activity of phytase family protein [Bifidobacterium crudilactis]MDN6558947.1 esterase-like activity of phytase family
MSENRDSRRVPRWAVALTAVAVGLTTMNISALTAGTAHADEASTYQSATATAADACSANVGMLGYTDALDNVTYNNERVGGLSSLAWDEQSNSYVSSLDNNGDTTARIWFLGSDMSKPSVSREPLILKDQNGNAYNGYNSDNEGLAVLPNGDYLVSSETEPSIRIYGRDGVQKSALTVPDRFMVHNDTTAASGEATTNLTLEGLTISPSGHQIVAAMEGSLSGDVSASDTLSRRFLVYRDDQAGAQGQWKLTKQTAFKVADAAKGISEISALSDDSVLVLQRSFAKASGNDVILSKASGLTAAPDVSGVQNLSAAPTTDFLSSQSLANLTNCKTLGATAKSGATQKNPLMDNYEGMAITKQDGDTADVSIISDNNFGATQTTRVLNLSVDTANYESDSNQPDLVSLLSDFSSLWKASTPFVSSDVSTFGKGTVGNASVLKHNDDMTKAINNAAAAGSTGTTPSAQQQRALVDSDYKLGETLPDALGPVLGKYLSQGISDGSLPMFTKLFTQTNQTGYGVSTLGDYVSTSKAKNTFNHPRPYVDRTNGGYPAAGLDKTVGIEKVQAWTDSTGTRHDPSYDAMTTSGSFPSGHTTYATSGAVGLATLLPELAPEILARGSEAGNNRIVLGVHYPLDIIGGRIDGDVANVARWSDATFVKDQLEPARQELVNYLTKECKANGYGSTLSQCITTTEANGSKGYANSFVDPVSTQPVTDRASAIKAYQSRMTYGFTASGNQTTALQKAVSTSVDQVPAGAENLLTTAYPTLTGAQRRQVLAQTALPVSGNPLQSSSQGYYNMDLASAMSAKVTLDDKGNVVAVAAGQSAPSVVKAADTNNGNNGNSDNNGGNSNNGAGNDSNGTGSNTGTDKGQAGANTATPKAGANDKAKASKQGKTASPLAKTGADVAMVAVAALIVLLAGGALILVSIRRRKQR